MARVALPARWVGALTRQHGPLRAYQWLWLLLCTVGGLAVAAPRILSQPVYYASAAAVRIDLAQRYHELYNAGASDPDFLAVQNQTLELLRARHPDLGAPTFGVRFEMQAEGQIAMIALGRSPAEAQRLADEAAEALVRNVRAAGGREIMRILMGSEMVVALGGNSPQTAFQRLLRDIIRTTAFPLNRPTDPVSEPMTVERLSPEDLSDLTRALEVRYEQIAAIELPALDARLQAAGAATGQILRDEERLKEGLRALGGALDYLYRKEGAVFAVDTPSVAYRRVRAPLPSAPVDRRILPLLTLAALVGLVFGGVGVAVDRSAGVMPKLRELWGYRELIRNLVLRDLRVRYKASAFGYLWTQLAPLLMMLVFWLVFSFFMPSGGIAMFPIFLIVALLPWNYCAEAVAGGARSVIDNANLIKKVFFPREVLPLVSVFSSLLNYLLSLPVMLLVMAVVQLLYPPLHGRLNFSWTFAYLPVLLIIQTLFLAGLVLFISALAVSFRDTVHLVGIMIQFWFFLTPVVYSLTSISANPQVAQIIRWLNPMASLIDFYRDILYGNVVSATQVPTPGLPSLASILRVLLTALIVLALGYWFFQRRSRQFGEEI